MDSKIITIGHSDRKQDAAPTWKKTWGHYPLLVFLDRPEIAGGEALAGLLRPGNAGSNTAADHVTVLGWALKSLLAAYRPDPREPGAQQILVCCDSAVATHSFAGACEIDTFRYRVLHVAARITRGARQIRLRIDATWRWATPISQAWQRLRAAFPRPPGSPPNRPEESSALESPPTERHRPTSHTHPQQSGFTAGQHRLYLPQHGRTQNQGHRGTLRLSRAANRAISRAARAGRQPNQ